MRTVHRLCRSIPLTTDAASQLEKIAKEAESFMERVLGHAGRCIRMKMYVDGQGNWVLWQQQSTTIGQYMSKMSGSKRLKVACVN